MAASLTRHVVEFHPWGDPVIVRHKKTAESVGIRLRDFGLGKFALDQLEVSTAGLWWYKNALAIFDTDGKSLIIRLGHGKFITVDLEQGRPMQDIPKTLEELGRRRSVEASAKLLRSADPFERETGAIVSGQETDAGMKRLCETYDLEYLDFYSSEQVTEESIPTISQMEGLRTLGVGFSGIAPQARRTDAVDQLVRRLPKCRVDYGD